MTSPQAILLNLYERLQEAYAGRRLPTPEETQFLIEEVKRSAKLLAQIKQDDKRPRRRGGPAEPAPIVEPPAFQTPKKPR